MNYDSLIFYTYNEKDISENSIYYVYQSIKKYNFKKTYYLLVKYPEHLNCFINGKNILLWILEKASLIKNISNDYKNLLNYLIDKTKPNTDYNFDYIKYDESLNCSLDICCKFGFYKLCEKLLQKGYNPNGIHKNIGTPLINSIKYGFYEISELLIYYNASIASYNFNDSDTKDEFIKIRQEIIKLKKLKENINFIKQMKKRYFENYLQKILNKKNNFLSIFNIDNFDNTFNIDNTDKIESKVLDLQEIINYENDIINYKTRYLLNKKIYDILYNE